MVLASLPGAPDREGTDVTEFDEFDIDGWMAELDAVVQPAPTAEDVAKQLPRIRALLAKAEDTAATEPEREAYNAKAAKLLAKYGIDRALLADGDPSTDNVIDRRHTMSAPYAEWKARLLSSIGQALGMTVVLTNGNVSAHVFGMVSDMERLDILFESLLRQQAHALAQDLARQVFYKPSDKTVYVRDFMHGFKCAVYTRLDKAESEARREATAERAESAPQGKSVELVLMDRTAKVKAEVSKVYPQLQTTRKVRQGLGTYSGIAAGERAVLSTKRTSGSLTG